MTRLISLGGALAAVSTALDGGPCLPLDVPPPQRASSGTSGSAPQLPRVAGTAPAPPRVERESPS